MMHRVGWGFDCIGGVSEGVLGLDWLDCMGAR